MNLIVKIILSGCLLFAFTYVPAYAMKQDGTFVTGKDLSLDLKKLKECKDAKTFELVEIILKEYSGRAYVSDKYDFEEKARWLKAPFEKAVKLLDLSEELIESWRDYAYEVKTLKSAPSYLYYLCDFYLNKLDQAGLELEEECEQEGGF